jgi:hypothetical protein
MDAGKWSVDLESCSPLPDSGRLLMTPEKLAYAVPAQLLQDANVFFSGTGK